MNCIALNYYEYTKNGNEGCCANVMYFDKARNEMCVDQVYGFTDMVPGNIYRVECNMRGRPIAVDYVGPCASYDSMCEELRME